MEIKHILCLSGGKDSTALALYIKEKYPEIHAQLEYVFYDTGCDLLETYTYLNKIKVFTGKEITRVKPKMSFEDILYKTKILPSVYNRWCTIKLKIEPSIEFMSNKIIKEHADKIKLYIGIRADEPKRKGANFKTRFLKEHIEPVYLFVEDGLYKEDIQKILETSGINYPEYYSWRPRNGCFFCPFQSKYNWISLYERHPDLFYKAMEYEKTTIRKKNPNFGFNPTMSLEQMITPENIKKIKEDYKKLMEQRSKKSKSKTKLVEIFS